MPLTRSQARDQIVELVKAVADTIPDFVPIYDDSRQDIPSESTVPLPTWARVQVRHGPGAQSSLADNAGETRYTKTGLVTIQLFTPAGDGLTLSDALSDQFEEGLRTVSTPNGVWFLNPRSVEVGEDGPWFQTNVLAEFRYDQIG